MICLHNYLYPLSSELVFKDGVSMLSNRELQQFTVLGSASLNQKYLRNNHVFLNVSK